MKRGFFAGAFDPYVHAGQLWAMRQAIEAGVCDTFIVGLDVDPSIDRAWKRKPICTVEERVEQLRAVKYISEIHEYRGRDALVELLKRTRPDARLLGEDYLNPAFRAKNMAGSDLLIPLWFAKRMPGWSATEFLERIDRRHKNEKLWGITQRIQEARSPAEEEVWFLHGLKGAASSMHKHDRKVNHFYVLSGLLNVIEQNGREEWPHLVRSRESFCVPPGTFHRMEFVEDSTVLEHYRGVDGHLALSSDISRLDDGWGPEGPQKGA